MAHVSQEFGFGPIGGFGSQLGLTQLHLLLFASGDVSDDADGKPTLPKEYRRQGKLNGKLLPVLSNTNEFQCFTNRISPTGFLPDWKGSAMGWQKAFRGDQLMQVLTHGFVCRIPEHDFSTLIPERNFPLVIHHGDGILSGRGDGIQGFVLGIQIVLGLFSLGEALQ